MQTMYNVYIVIIIIILIIIKKSSLIWRYIFFVLFPIHHE